MEPWAATFIEGPDARSFLQRITTTDVLTLAHSGTLSFVLSPNGRLRCAFFLFALSDEEFIALTPEKSHGLEPVQAVLEQFHFSEAITIHPLSSPAVISMQSRNIESQKPWATNILAHGARVFDIGLTSPPHQFQLLFQIASNARPAIPNESTEVFPDEFIRARIRSGTPWWGHEISKERNPLEIGAGRYIPEQKGCYPGQEVIERIRTQGAPPYRLCQVEFTDDGISESTTHSGSFEIMALEDRHSNSIGKVTSHSPGSRLALALVRKICAKPEFAFQGGSITQVFV